MKGFAHTIPVTKSTVDARTGQVENVQEVRFGLMPPAADQGSFESPALGGGKPSVRSAARSPLPSDQKDGGGNG